MEKQPILIVEDNAIIALCIKKMLTDFGYEVVGHADSGEQAIQKAVETRPALVLMDIELIGEMNGIEAAEQIRRQFDIPVIYLTAYSDDTRLQQAKTTAPYGYLIKPIQGRELYAAIEMALYKHKSEQQQRQIEAHIHYNQKTESLGRMSGAVAHNFNNIMATILGYAELMQLELSPNSPVQPMIQEILTATMRASKITRQILEYTGQIQSRPEKIHLSMLIRDMTPLIEVSISKKITLAYELTDKIPVINIDPNQIRQIVINLISNASEAIGEQEGTITIRTEITGADRAFLSEPYLDADLPEGKYAAFEISDTGCGMDESIKAKIFDPFFTTKFLGRGLGLPAVLGIVRQYRGAIKVFSTIGSGTTIKVLFPI
jgi:signal transduction histidine kinase